MLSTHVKQVLEGLSAYTESKAFTEGKGPFISVDKLSRKAGAFYEKVRYLIDYKEGHTIRRNAIERILKRKLSFEKIDNVGLSLLQELVSGRYLPNDKMPESVANDIQKIVSKYSILQNESGVEKSISISFMATEIERFLYPQLLDELVVEAFYRTMSGRIKYTEGIVPEDMDTQIYIGCRRSLLEDDYNTLFYSLLIRRVPVLYGLGDDYDKVKRVAPDFSSSVKLIQSDMKSTLGLRLLSKLRNHSVYFSVIQEIIKKYGKESESIFNDSSKLNSQIESLMSKRYKQQSNLVSKSGTQAVIYIFLTKIILAVIFELPYERFFLSHIDYFALSTNIIFHPLLLLIMTKTTHHTSPKNTANIISGVHDALFVGDIKPIYIKPPVTNVALRVLFALLYVVLFAISFGAILWILNLLNFNIVSIVLFLLFLTLVSYFGFRIRQKAKKWVVSEKDEGIVSLLWNFFTVPIVRTGRWLNRRFSSINAFIFIMDFVIETPFKFILGTFDSFVSFLKERREDPY